MADDIFDTFKTTSDLPVPPKLVDQVIGQEHAVEIIKKAARQKRHILLIGDPGTGKSMLGQAMAELLPVEELKDVLIHPNLSDKNNPKIEIVKAGEGDKVVERFRIQKKSAEAPINFLFKLLFFAIIFMVIYYSIISGPMVLFGGIVAAVFLLMGRQYIKVKEDILIPKLLINNVKKDKAPFVDATGSHAGALLGDVRHDPFQSGGLETPPHELIEAGAVHRANGGVLFIDEISTLEMKSQQELLGALQDKELSITGRSERSSGAMVRTEPVPCDFVLVAAGNLEALKDLHPALRSRITGYGYEIYMKDVMDDTKENRKRLMQFVAQEVVKDGKIPHFSRDAAEEMIKEAGRRAGRKGKLTLALRSLGGLIRAAGDVARSEDANAVTKAHVTAGKDVAKSLEQQIADRYISRKKDYRVFEIEGKEVGRVNGLAVIGDSGVILPIVAEVAPALSRDEGKMIATGKLKTIAREAVKNVSALVKKHTGKDISNYDIHVQFLQTYEGVEGDSASVSVAAAVISALEGVPVDQQVAMTGSLSVRGDVLPVGGVTPKVEAAISAGIKRVIIPVGNSKDVMVDRSSLKKIEVIHVSSLNQVLENALVWKGREGLLRKIQGVVPATAKGFAGIAPPKKHKV